MTAKRKWVVGGGLAVVCALLSTGACAADMVLLNGIPPDAQEGTVVQLREAGPKECLYLGTFHKTAHTTTSWTEKILVKILAAGGEKVTDWSIEIKQQTCGQVVSKTAMWIPLSQGHTYINNDGEVEAGYGPGDSVARIPQKRLEHD